jgi:hypothetical protein
MPVFIGLSINSIAEEGSQLEVSSYTIATHLKLAVILIWLVPHQYVLPDS